MATVWPGARWGRVVIGDADLPPRLRRGPRGGDVPAEADKHPAVQDLRDLPGAAIGGPRLGGRAEVEEDALGQLDQPLRAVETDPPPARHRGGGRR